MLFRHPTKIRRNDDIQLSGPALAKCCCCALPGQSVKACSPGWALSAALAGCLCCFLLVLCAAADVIRGLVRPLVTGRAAGWIPGGRPDPFTSSCLREKHGMTKLRGHHQSLDPEWLHLCYVCEPGLYIYSRPTIDCTTYRLSSCQRAPHFSIAYPLKRLTGHQTIRPSHDIRHHSSWRHTCPAPHDDRPLNIERFVYCQPCATTRGSHHQRQRHTKDTQNPPTHPGGKNLPHTRDRRHQRPLSDTHQSQ